MYKATKIAFEIIGIITAGVFACGFLYLIGPILFPFIIAFILAYICNPLINRLNRLGISRPIAVSLVMASIFILIFLFLLIFIPVLHQQGVKLIELINSAQSWVQAKLAQENIISLPAEKGNKLLSPALSHNLLQNLDMIPSVFNVVFASGRRLLEAMLGIIVIPILVFYFLRDAPLLTKKMSSCIPLKLQPYVYRLGKECDDVLGAFFRGQLLVMLFLCCYYSLTLTLLGLQASIVLGVIIGMLSIFPYIGGIIGILLAGMVALVQGSPVEWLLWLGLIFLVGHAVENFCLTPTLIGDRIGIHPVMVIFVILAGGVLFGLVGMLFAIPCAALLRVIIRFITQNFYSLKEACN